jgi:hypothetical protein
MASASVDVSGMRTQEASSAREHMRVSPESAGGVQDTMFARSCNTMNSL